MPDETKNPDAVSEPQAQPQPPQAESPAGRSASAEPPSGPAGTDSGGASEVPGSRPESAALQEAAPPSEAQAPGVQALVSEIESLKDRLLRAHADMDNLRKRAEREKADTAKYAIAKFARDVIEAGDSFQYAINAVSQEAAEKDPVLKSFLDGVTLAERSFLAVLDRHGIRQINPQGAAFDPHEHHAAGEEHNPEVAAGTVVKVYQVGYKLDDRVLRPAMVVVAKGGTRPGSATPGDGRKDTPAASDVPGGGAEGQKMGGKTGGEEGEPGKSSRAESGEEAPEAARRAG